MKKPILSILLLLLCVAAYAQNPSYTDKLFYTCKLYGFVKYYHSEVSTCKVNWDSVLIDRLPAVKAANTKDDFNDVLVQMLNAAGPMAQAGTPLPDTLPAELKRNRDWGWTNDALLRSDVSALLNNIKTNFLPHDICWVADNDYSDPANNGWLIFPADTNYVEDITVQFPPEEKRLMIYFKYWNILNYFNPYKYVLDKPWNTSFYDMVPLVFNATNAYQFKAALVKLNKELNDAHVEISNPNIIWLNGTNSPKFSIRYASGKYIAVAPFLTINRGDEITHINGLTATQWEDSLRNYISAGNETVFRRFVRSYMIAGKKELFSITYKDSNGVSNVCNTNRIYAANTYEMFYANDSMKARAKIGYFPCGIAYINPSNISIGQLEDYYYAVQSSSTLIIDIRSYVEFENLKKLCTLMYPNETTVAMFTEADVEYPGTYKKAYATIGGENNDPYTGKVILLTYETDQSYGEFTAMHLQQLSNVVTVGTQTAGADGNITFAPNIFKGARFCFTSLGVYYPNGDSTQRIGVGPRRPGDVLVQLTQEGIRHNRDEILEAALKAAGCALNAEEINAVMSGVTIYPNPTTGTFSVEVDKNTTATVSIFSQTGQLVLQTTQTENIDISSLPAGTYMVRIISNSITTTQKLIKQ